MDSNKHEPIKPTTPPTEPEWLTEAEVAELRTLLQEVYPAPKCSIKEGVMARIHAETAAETAKKDQKADKAAARRKRQALFMKWGGMAACVTILCGALVIASPMLSKSGYTAADQAAPVAAMSMDMPTEAILYADVETHPETAAAESSKEENGAPAVMRSMLMSATADAATEEAEDADAIRETEATVAQTTAAPVEEKSAVVAKTEAEEYGYTRESMSAEAKEAFVGWLIDQGYLTADRYRAWLTDKGFTDAGDWQADQLCEAFGLDIALTELWANEQ